MTPPGPRLKPCLAYSSASRSRLASADEEGEKGYGPTMRPGLLLLLLLVGLWLPGVCLLRGPGEGKGLYLQGLGHVDKN